MRTFFIIVFLLGAFLLRGQSFAELSRYEKCWALWHPFAAVKVKKHLPEARRIYREVKDSLLLDAYESGGSLDAFRHTFVMAYLAQRVSVRHLRRLGKTHEKANRRDFEKGKTEFGEPADSLACQMDLLNNEVGFALGRSHRQLDAQALKRLVIAGIREGKSYLLLRDAAGHYLRCDGTVIRPEEYRGRWQVPKCLVPSVGP